MTYTVWYIYKNRMVLEKVLGLEAIDKLVESFPGVEVINVRDEFGKYVKGWWTK